MNKAKYGVTILLAAAIGLFSIGCGGKKSDTQSSSKSENAAVRKVLHYYGNEPQTLDANLITGAPEMNIVNMFKEGLMRSGKEEGKYIPGVAESYTYDEATNSYTFKLRADAKWQDGTPVTVDDFLFGWRRAIDDNSAYSFLITDYIKGTEEYLTLSKEAFLKKTGYKGKDIKKKAAELTEKENAAYQRAKDELWKKISVSVDGNSITIGLALPAPYFPALMAFSVFMPVKASFYEEHKVKNSDYGSEATGLNANGPWKVKEWSHNDKIVLERNEHYWNNSNIKIDEINLKLLKNVDTRTNLLRTGELDGAAIQAKDLPAFQDVGTLQQYDLQELVNRPDYTVFYMEYNHHNNKITKNANIRRAISYALDKQSFVEKINLGDEPANALIPQGFPGLNKSFREENGKELFKMDKEAAKKYLAKGLKELKLKKLPKLDMLIGESDIANKISQKFQQDCAEIGIQINLVPLPWGEQLNRIYNGDFAMSSSGWGPDYPDPMTFLEIFRTGNGNNKGKYSNKKFDKLIDDAKREKNAEKRMQYLYQAEKIIIDDMVISPQYFRVAHWTFKNYVSGVIHRGIGPATDFYWADIDMNAKLRKKK